MKIKFNDSLYSGWSNMSMAPDAEARLLQENQERMHRLYDPLYQDLVLLQRRNYVIVWHKHPDVLLVDGRKMTVRAFKALAKRERALAAADRRDGPGIRGSARQPTTPATPPVPINERTTQMSNFTSPRFDETAAALDASWANDTQAAHALRLIDRALEVEIAEEDGHWLDELRSRRAAALAYLTA